MKMKLAYLLLKKSMCLVMITTFFIAAMYVTVVQSWNCEILMNLFFSF